jgi:PhnB protein
MSEFSRRPFNPAAYGQKNHAALEHGSSKINPTRKNSMTNRANSSANRETTLAPMLSVRNGARAVEFYQAALGASTLFRLDAEDGAVVAQMSLGESQFWLADESPEHRNFSPESLGGSTARMVMVVEDPDASFQRAVDAGATVVRPVTDEPYGWRVGRIVDPFGHHWEIGKPLN